ncbi:MAG: hypothetical protein IRZ32_16585, partial [Solirubrobacteraceae bacterium]|nr:hypothetical protein [Solirubrobacteraceae bacterium]
AGTALLAPAAPAAIFGTEPLAISVAPGPVAPDGEAANPAVSGDNRRTRYAAFDSTATNLVGGDTNGRADVFVWARPRGAAGLRLADPGGGRLVRASVSSAGAQADGDSTNPSLDGSTRHRPRCVAFQSTATNLAPGDGDPVPDVFVRDLRRGRTRLVSRGVALPATNPSIDGACRTVVFEAGGAIHRARVAGGAPKRIAAGSGPDVSLDGTAVAWVRGGDVLIRRRGRTDRVGPGANPTVGDDDSGTWAVSFDTAARLARNDRNPGRDVYMRLMRGGGGPRGTDLISATRRGGASLGGDSVNGGITAYAGTRGIVVFVNHRGGGSDLYYRNNHTGNIDDLAHAPASSPIAAVVTSARANFVAFASTATFVGPTGGRRAVFFKHLVDGEAV